MVERKLGRGLEMLIGKGGAPKGVEVVELDPGSIDPNPEQPRKKFSRNEMDLLKGSIAREGLLQPLVVRRQGERYQLVAGERRLRAAQELGLKSIPALLVPASDERMLELALVENIQREDLNPVDVARAFASVMATKGWTQEVLAQTLSLSRPSVANLLRLLELPQDMQDSVARGHITPGHAKVLLSIADPEEQRLLFERIAEEKLSVRDLEGERETTGRKGGAGGGKEGKPRRGKKKQSPHLVSLEEQFSERLGTKVTIHEGRGKGRIVIEFYTSEDFDRIREVLVPGNRKP